MSKKTVLEYPAEANPEDADILYLIKGLTDRNITLRKMKDYILGSLNRTVKDTAEIDSGTILTANGVNELIARVGKLYMQYPFMPTPDDFYGVGTWLNISSRAVGYGISDTNDGDPTSYISREDADQGMDFAESDLAVDDAIASGTYAGMYVRSVESYTGLFFRVEGGDANSYGAGFQQHQFQGHEHTTSLWEAGGTGYSYGETSQTSGRSNKNSHKIVSKSGYGTVSYGTETRPVNRTNRIWIRTA